METKYSKVFAKKLLALFLSVLMALTSFTGALSAYAASVQSDKDFHDGNLASNFMAWAETTDEQTCEALLDWADMHIGDLMTSLLGDSHLKIYYNAVVLTINIDGYLDSVDGVFDLLNQVDNLLTGTVKNLAGGDIKNINLDPVGSDLKPSSDASKTMSRCGKAYRSEYSAKELILALARFLEVNSNDIDGKNVIGNFVKGTLNLGSIINGILKKDVYDLLQDALGMWSGYKTNLVYNIVANLILENTKWFSDSDLAKYRADIRTSDISKRSFAFNFDDVLFTALQDKLLDEVHANITYPNYILNEAGNLVNDSSKERYKRICKILNVDKLDGSVDQSSAEFKAAAKQDAADNNYTYNESIIYFTNNTKDPSATSDMDGETGDVFVFQKRNGDKVDKLLISKSDNLYAFAFRALEFAWTTALQDTVGLIHVNYDVNRGHGANFDNQYFYWVSENRTWNTADWKSNYEASQVKAWAEAVYKDYGCESADEFLANVKHTFDYDRSVVADAKNNWQDIDPTTLFNKLRYNPLADLYFDIQTGPINLYFEQTGIDPISTFFDTAFTNYSNMVAGLNDALVAVTEVIWLDSKNIGVGSIGESDARKPAEALSVPKMEKTGNTTNADTIAATLIGNVAKMFEYSANVADANILNPFYQANSISTYAGNLSEGNFEEAMIPLLIAVLQQVNMTEPIHDEKWDSCKDAEGVAIVALEEYLSYVLPDKDYSVLWTYDEDGFIVANSGQKLFDNAIMPMVRDALGYIISPVVPCRTADGKPWDVYSSKPTDSTTIFEILNSVMCYYAGQDSFSDGTTGKAVATLLGVVDSSNNPLVSIEKDLWTNLDNIINTLLPAIGTAQYGTVAYYGKANSKDLIYNDLISGFLDIGTPNEKGDMGITNFVKRLITIITSDPVSANKATPHDSGTNMIEMIYNLLADVMNNLLGSRTDSRYSVIVPYADYYDTDSYTVDNKVRYDDTKRETPFDSLLTTSTLGYFSNGDGKHTGMIGILIYNVFKAFGGNNTTTGNTKTPGTMGCWQGAMFAVKAVNNFIPSFVASLSDHTLGTVSASVLDSAQSGLATGNKFTATKLDITNNSIGLNRFYKDPKTGEVKRSPRYFVYIEKIEQSNDTGASNVTIGSYDRVIAPEKTLRVDLSGNAPASPTTYTFEITYSIFKGEMNGTTLPSYSADKAIYTGLKTKAYMYLTNVKDWESEVYDAAGHFNSGLYYTKANQSNTFTHSTATGGTSNQLVPTLPYDYIVKMSDPNSIGNRCFYVKNTSSSLVGSKRAFDGLIATLMAGDKYYPVSGTTISDTLTTAPASSDSTLKNLGISDKYVGYAAIDEQTGDLVNYLRYDYTTDGGKTWDLGPVIFDDFACGYSQSELDALDTSIKESGDYGVREHHAWTLEQAMAHGIVRGVNREKSKYIDGKQTYIYKSVLLDLNASYMNEQKTVNGSKESVATKLLKGAFGHDGYESISWGTKTPGIYFATSKYEVDKGSEAWMPMLKYDGSTTLEPDSYQMGVFLYTTNNANMVASVNMYVADDSASTDLRQSYSKALELASTYQESDFDDYENGSSQAFQDMAAAIKKAVSTVATPINTSNAGHLGSVMVTLPNTTSTTNTVGEKAYQPIKATTAIDPAIQANATKDQSDIDGVQYWYYNADKTVAVCSNKALTDADVVDNKVGATGDPVQKINGVWYYTNTPQYEREWDTTTYETPYRKLTDRQVTDAKGALIYDQITFTTYDTNGNAMDSRGKWDYIIANQSKQIKENVPGEDNRGLYQRDVDNLAYYTEQLEANVNTEIASLIVEQVTDDRQGMNNVNHDVASYEKMVQVAQDAERLIWSEAVGEPVYYAYNEAGEKVVVTLSDQSTPLNTLYEDEEGNLYKNEAVWSEQEYSYKTNKSKLQIDEAIRVYEEFKTYVKDRGYIGDKLEAEINCATGYDYTALDYEKTEAEDVVTNAVIKSSTATEAKYGTWENGVLVNKKADGTQAYTDESWTAYVIALANGIQIADEQTERVSATYTAKTDIQKAENNLVEFEGEDSDTFKVSGRVMIAVDPECSATSEGIVGIKIYAGRYEKSVAELGEPLGETAADGTFTIEVPAGTTELTLAGPTTIDRVISVSGTEVTGAIIPIVICDYNHDGYINSGDTALFGGYLEDEEYYVYADISGDTYVNSGDTAFFGGFVGETIIYDELTF